MTRQLIRAVVLGIAGLVGTRIRDYNTGEDLGKALLIPWRGRIHVIGLKPTVRPMFQPQQRLTYWKQEIVFSEHRPPDYLREAPEIVKDIDSQSGQS